MEFARIKQKLNENDMTKQTKCLKNNWNWNKCWKNDQGNQCGVQWTLGWLAFNLFDCYVVCNMYVSGVYCFFILLLFSMFLLVLFLLSLTIVVFVCMLIFIVCIMLPHFAASSYFYFLCFIIAMCVLLLS